MSALEKITKTFVELFVLGAVFYFLWNWLAPSLFGWGVVTFWQALGVSVFIDFIGALLRRSPYVV